MAQPRGRNNYNVRKDGEIIFPRAPPWRARGYPVPAVLFGGEARAAVSLPLRIVGRDGIQCFSTESRLTAASEIPGQGRHMVKRDASLPRLAFLFRCGETLPSIPSPLFAQSSFLRERVAKISFLPIRLRFTAIVIVLGISDIIANCFSVNSI